MKLTGKCRIDFEKFLIIVFPEIGIKNNNWSKLVYKWFIIQNLSMQYGIYVDFFDSVGIKIGIVPIISRKHFFKFWVDYDGKNIEGDLSEKRLETRARAIEKANEIYNDK